MKDRITNIEIQLMHHENMIQHLSDVIARQQVDIEKMLREIKVLSDQLRIITPSGIRTADEEEPPPHY
ncbi:MAG TPA: SlyX family protein [Geobacteraceae bacterium]|nr:SlyX family protein [Geobacteraceae bacterium]